MAVIPLVALVLAVVWSLVVLRGVLARIGPKPTYDDWDVSLLFRRSPRPAPR